MFKTKKMRIATLAVVGILTLGGAAYATSALVGQPEKASAATSAVSAQAPAGVAAGPSTTTTTQSQQDQQQLRADIADMLKDHMGLSGTDAANLATTMADLMQKTHGNIDLGTMVKQCAQAGGTMMGQQNMMNDNTQATGTQINPSSHASHHSAGTVPAVGGNMMGTVAN